MNNTTHSDGRGPGIFIVLVLSIIILTLAGAALIMGSLIFQFSRGDLIFGKDEEARVGDQLVIYRSDAITAEEPASADVASAVMPSVAIVHFNGEDTLGLVLSSGGYILTEARFTGEPTVELGGREYPAELVSSDVSTGLGIVRVSADNLRAAAFGNSDDVYQGSRVYKIDLVAGEPAIFEGIVSALYELPARYGQVSSSEVTVPAVAADIPPSGSSFCLLVDAGGRIIAAGSCLEDTPCTGAFAANYVAEMAALALAD